MYTELISSIVRGGCGDWIIRGRIGTRRYMYYTKGEALRGYREEYERQRLLKETG